MSNETTLLPCICGSKAHMCEMESGYGTEYAICCNNKRCRLSEHPRFGHVCKTEAEAIATWNARATHGTLTAEQVREAIERHSAWVIGNNRCFHDGAYEEIADELNARAERTCRIVEYDEAPYPVCSECGAVQPDDYTVYFCWNCGAKVRDE